MRSARVPAWAGLAAVVVLAAAAWGEWDGSRTRPVHRIPLYDENGEKISPYEQRGRPFSCHESCQECHDYETITMGWHFNSCDPDVPSGPKGEPWIVVDSKTGTQLPLSHRSWEGAWKPDDVGMSLWEYTKAFARHMPGGDWAEKRDVVPDPHSRWNVSGYVPVNCLACHNASPIQNQSDYVIQIARENFRWAATQASGLGTVGAIAARLDPTWDPVDGPNLDNEWAQAPWVDYDAAWFDTNNKVVLDLRAEPPTDRCYFCHTTATVGETMEELDDDIHVQAGMVCADCHRNGLSHQIMRGKETGQTDPALFTLTCRGCHYGNGLNEGGLAEGGRFAAPRPEHPGLPEYHLEELACTACHSGLWPEQDAQHIRKARANRLGVHGQATWATDLPSIQSPVFLKNHNDRIAPHHLFWPSFWAYMRGDDLTPLLPEAVATAAGAVLEPEAQVVKVLGVLKPKEDEEAVPVYAVGGIAYEPLTLTRLDGVDREDAPMEPTWRIRRGQTLEPIIEDTLVWTVEGIVEHPQPLTDSQIAKMLAEIEYEGVVEGEAVYVQGGKLYHYSEEKGLSAEDPPEGAKEYAWCDLNEDQLTELEREVIKNAAEEMLNFEQPVTQEKIGALLSALVPVCKQGEPVYLSAGKLYRLKDGMLEPSDPPQGAPEAPAYWGQLTEEGVAPLVPTYVSEALGSDGLTKEQVRLVLAALAEDEVSEGTPVYIGGGKLFKIDAGDLVSTQHPAAAYYAWSFGHDVRPAAQALGAEGRCSDCHTSDSPFFFGDVLAEVPANIEQASVFPMFELQGYARDDLGRWNRSVLLRPLTVYGGLLTGALIAFTLLRYGFMALEAILRALVIRGGKDAA
ncbi:MAG TPA: hypothetical protein ENN80_12305, partial [Candidatus Hydrogenedentes bacterium]|nr:hypothetical protein [Candidatus Hydrogenedentota bacterium]